MFRHHAAPLRLVKDSSASASAAPIPRRTGGLYQFWDTLVLIRRIAVDEGWRALYKGLGPALAGIIPARSAPDLVSWQIHAQTQSNQLLLLPYVQAHARSVFSQCPDGESGTNSPTRALLFLRRSRRSAPLAYSPRPVPPCRPPASQSPTMSATPCRRLWRCTLVSSLPHAPSPYPLTAALPPSPRLPHFPRLVQSNSS